MQNNMNFQCTLQAMGNSEGRDENTGDKYNVDRNIDWSGYYDGKLDFQQKWMESFECWINLE